VTNFDSAYIYVSIVGVVFATVWSNVKRGDYTMDMVNVASKGYRSKDAIPNRFVFTHPEGLSSVLDVSKHLPQFDDKKDDKEAQIVADAVPLAIMIQKERPSHQAPFQKS
jgi:FtsZ-interacting cell division protein ZipA